MFHSFVANSTSTNRSYRFPKNYLNDVFGAFQFNFIAGFNLTGALVLALRVDST